MRRTSKNGWIPLTLNLKVSDPHQAAVLEALESIEDSENLPMSEILRQLVVAGLGIPMPSDSMDERIGALTGIIGNLQSQLEGMAATVDELSHRQVTIIQTTPSIDAPIDAIGESVVYDGSVPNTHRPLSEDFKQAVIKAAQKRSQAMRLEE